MWWERWIPKLYLTKSNICGVECIYSETGISFNYAVLNIKKNKAEVSLQGTTTDAKEILILAKKLSAPVSLAIVGKGVITKKIIFSENDSLVLTDLLSHHLPAIPANDFYVQFFKNESNSGHISVCRKEQVNELLALFTMDKIEIVNVFLGVLVCNALANLTGSYNRLTTSTQQLELMNGYVESIMPLSDSSSVSLDLGETTIQPSHSVSFAIGLSYLTQQENYHSTNVELTHLPIQHVEKIKTRLLLFVFIIFLFIISAINSVLFFQKFEENSALEVELNLYESKNNQITQLLDSYQKKKSLIEQTGIFDNKKMSVYADKIAASLPNEILLRELYFNPEEGETEEDSLTNFTENELIIKGNCNKSLLLNEWINILKSQNFIKAVNLETFIYNSEGHLPNFVLKVDTK